MQPLIRTGFVLGTGAAINVELGFIPDYVRVANVTDGDKENIWARARVMAFTSGGTHVLAEGDLIQGATNVKVRARVKQVMVTSGTFAGGDAAGLIIFDVLDETGSFGSENVDLVDPSGGPGIETANVATVALQAETANWALGAALATATPAQGILPYVGVAASNSRGFTITATTSESGKLLHYIAMRAGSET